MTNPLESLNITLVSDVTKEQFINIANQTVAIPVLVLLFILMSLIFLVIGLFMVKRDKGKFLSIWLFSIILSAIILIFLIYSPNTILNLIEKIRDWFK